ncbi:MAG: PEP-CTERM sorting domain-containing protein [Phycisphaerales bacterium]
MNKTISVVAIAAVAGLASAQTDIVFNNVPSDGAQAFVFTVHQSDHGPLDGFSWDLTYSGMGVSWGSEVNILLEHLPSGFSFSFDGSENNFADLGPDDVSFGWGNTAGPFAAAGAAAVIGGPSDTFGDWRVTVTEEFDDSGIDAIINGRITINKVPAPGSLALVGMGGLAALRRRRR